MTFEIHGQDLAMVLIFAIGLVVISIGFVCLTKPRSWSAASAYWGMGGFCVYLFLNYHFKWVELV